MAVPVPSPQLCSEAAPRHALSPSAPLALSCPGDRARLAAPRARYGLFPSCRGDGGATPLYLPIKVVSFCPPPRVGEDVFVFIQPLEIYSVPGYLCWLVIMRDTAGT